MFDFYKNICFYNDLEGISDKYSNKVFQIGNLVED